MSKQTYIAPLTISLLSLLSTAHAADLATTFSSTYSKVAVNNTLTYTASVMNKASDTASNVRLLFYVPFANIGISSIPQNCLTSAAKVICTIGDMASGDSATRSISLSFNKKGGALVSANAISDSYESNKVDNLSRLLTNVTSTNNVANAPLIPSVFSAKVSPTSLVQGNTLTFSANLTAPLPSGYSVKINYDSTAYAMNGSGTNYSLTQTPSTAGVRTFRAGVYDSTGNLQGSEMTGTFTVTQANTAPTLSLVSGADSVVAGSAYTLQLQGNDADNNLSWIAINWGDGVIETQNTISGSTLSFSHTFSSAGTYTLTAIAYDSAGASSSAVTKTVTVTRPVTTKTFSYTKIANNGSILPDSATLGTGENDWACTKDNNTGLIWEVKTDDDGLRDKDWTYSWYKPDGDNGGGAGYQSSYEQFGVCKGSGCDTDAYTNAVNQQGLCGANNWRMPTKGELESLVYCSDGKYASLGLSEMGITCSSNGAPNYNLTTQSPTINQTYFPYTPTYSVYWSSSPYASYGSLAWNVYFSNGGSYNHSKGTELNVRLVR